MTGTVTISVEIELGWGYHDIDSDDRYDSLSERRTAETETLNRFLRVLDEHRIPISFDVVGHLFLDDCNCDHAGPHPDGWFDSDPGTNVERDPLFYAPDLIDIIEEAETDHEICTHTFSHVLCDEISDETLQAELKAAQQLHRDRIGEKTVSLVAPRHREAPKSVLNDSEIEIIRVPADDFPEGRLARLYWYLFGRHPVMDPTERGGIIESPTSTAMSLTAYHLPTGQTTPHPVFRAIPKVIRRRLHQRYLLDALERACQRDSHIHLWTHLHDMTSDSQWPAMNTFLESLEVAVSEGSATVATMEQLASDSNPNGDPR